MTPVERADFTKSIVAALKDGDHMLNDDERQWVRLAIKREAQSFQLRQAIIEKTLSGLVWFFVVGIGYVFIEFLRGKGLKI